MTGVYLNHTDNELPPTGEGRGMKELEGKTVYLRPTGNNARRGTAEVQKAFIVKVAKVNVTFILNGMSREFKYRFKGRELRGECNGGLRCI